MRKNVISEIHNMKKKMGLVNEMNFEDIDNESLGNVVGVFFGNVED